MKIAELKHAMDAGFKEMRDAFARVDERLARHDERFEKGDKRFEAIDRRFEQIDKRFEEVDKRFDRLEQRLVEESEMTRRHFAIALEQMKAERDLVLDQSLTTAEKLAALSALHAVERAATGTRLADHERRLAALERPRSIGA